MPEGIQPDPTAFDDTSAPTPLTVHISMVELPQMDVDLGGKFLDCNHTLQSASRASTPSSLSALTASPSSIDILEKPLPLDRPHTPPSMDVDISIVSAGPSRHATPSCARKSSSADMKKAPFANKDNQPCLEHHSDTAPVHSAGPSSLVVMSTSTKAKRKSATRERSLDKDATSEVRLGRAPSGAVTAKAEKSDSDVIRPPRPSKPVKRKDHPELAKRKKRAEEGGEEPVKKKSRGVKAESARALFPKDLDEAPDQADGFDASEVVKVKADRKADKTNASSSKSKPGKKPKRSDLASTSSASALFDLEPPVIAEIQGMLIESFAVSRASSLPGSALHRTITANRPSLKSERTKEQWLEVIEAVLEDGQRTSGVFGKVESSFKVRFCVFPSSSLRADVCMYTGRL